VKLHQLQITNSIGFNKEDSKYMNTCIQGNNRTRATEVSILLTLGIHAILESQTYTKIFYQENNCNSQDASATNNVHA
jgi:hypothetical protein